MKTFFITGILLTITIGINIAQANTNEEQGLLDVLRENGTITQQQYENLKQAVRDNASSAVQLSTKGGIKVTTNDENFSFQLVGRLMFDSAFYDEDKNPLGNGTEIRRARLEIKGTLFKDWGFDLGIEFPTEAEIKNAFIHYNGFSSTNLTIGHTKEPFCLQNQTSSKYITFMERALPFAFSPNRSMGIKAETWGQTWTASAGIFGDSFDDDVEDEGNEGWATTGRFTYVPFQSDTHTLHLGIATSYRMPDDKKQLRFRTRPESHITDMRYVDTGTLNHVDHFNLYGLEAAGVFNAFSLQGEYIRTDVSREEDLSGVTFAGWYLYGSWFLTGESRPYKGGKFGNIKPKNKHGAWELATRYSVLDLNDGSISGGEEKNITLGLNWYINKQLRVMANYIIVDNDQDANANGNAIGKDNPNIFQMRFQAHF